MNSGGENESDHSPLIIDGGGFTAVQDGDDNERLPWEFSDGEEVGAAEEFLRAKTLRSAERRNEAYSKAASPPSGVTFAAHNAAGARVYRKASSVRANLAAAPKAAAAYSTATLTEIRFVVKSPTSNATENESLTTSATVTPLEHRSFEFQRGAAAEFKSAPAHRRKPSISTLSGYQEYSTPPQWCELPRLDDPTRPLRLVSEPEGQWSAICAALQDLRCLVLHDPDATDLIVRKDATMLLVLIPRILELIDNPRSLVAKNAITTLHDIFLFTPSHVPGNLVIDSLNCVLKRCAGSSFLAEEAMRCTRQIIITGDTLRVLHTLMTVLNKQGRNFATLRYAAIHASGLFLLRLKAQALQAVLQHRDFVTSFLKPIVKATNDASQECRCAAAECCMILINLWPDLRFKFKNWGSECDINAALTRARKLYKPVAQVYDMNAVAEAYSRCPDNATIEIAFDRLQTILANIEEISRQPLDGESGGYLGPSQVSRSVTPSSKGRISPNVRVLSTNASVGRPACRSPPTALSGGGEREFCIRRFTASPAMDRLTTPTPERAYARSAGGVVSPSLGGLCDRSRESGSLLSSSRPSERGKLLSPSAVGASKFRVSLNSRLTVESEGRRQLTPSSSKRVMPAEFDEAQLPAYATRGNLRYAPNSSAARCCAVEEQRRFAGEF